jgi:predicted nucleic acid-binding protein
MGKSVTMPMVFIDSTVLSNFALIGRTDLVYSLWHDSARTTKAVMEEYQAGSDVLNLPEKAWEKLVVHELSAKEIDQLASVPSQLGTGERSCLAAAIVQGAVFASDDRLARKRAIEAGLIVVGSIGILIQCIKKGLIDKPATQELLDKMINAGFYSPINNLDEIFE